MGFRFRRSIRLAPGIRWNIGKASSSISIGPRGAKLTMGTKGTHVSAGLPGSGLFYTEKISSAPRAQASALVAPSPKSSSSLWWFISAGFLGMVAFASGQQPAGIVAAALFIVGLIVGYSKEPALSEAEKETQVQLAAYRAEAESAIAERSQDRLRRLLDPSLFGLGQAEVGVEVERVRGVLQLVEFSETIERTGEFPIVSGHSQFVGDDLCYYAGTAFIDLRGNSRDEAGQVFLTNKKLLFVGSAMKSVPWQSIVVLSRDGQSVTVQRRDREHPYAFYFNTMADAVIAQAIGDACLKRTAGGNPSAALHIVK